MQGKQDDLFCFKIIGAAIESDLSPRVKQILRNGVYYLLHSSKKAPRELDVSGALFRGDGTNYLLGNASYYDGFRRVCPELEDVIELRIQAEEPFQDLLQAVTSATKIYHTAATNSVSEPVSDNIGVRRSPTATTAAQ